MLKACAPGVFSEVNAASESCGKVGAPDSQLRKVAKASTMLAMSCVVPLFAASRWMPSATLLPSAACPRW